MSTIIKHNKDRISYILYGTAIDIEAQETQLFMRIHHHIIKQINDSDILDMPVSYSQKYVDRKNRERTNWLTIDYYFTCAFPTSLLPHHHHPGGGEDKIMAKKNDWI